MFFPHPFRSDISYHGNTRGLITTWKTISHRTENKRFMSGFGPLMEYADNKKNIELGQSHPLKEGCIPKLDVLPNIPLPFPHSTVYILS